jgi:hypothetical protein
MPVDTFVMDRQKRSIKISNPFYLIHIDDVFDETILSISQIEFGSTNDFYLMLHYLNKLVFYDPRLEKSVYTIPKSLHPSNVIEFRRSISIEAFDKENDYIISQDMFSNYHKFNYVKEQTINRLVRILFYQS